MASKQIKLIFLGISMIAYITANHLNTCPQNYTSVPNNVKQCSNVNNVNQSYYCCYVSGKSNSSDASSIDNFCNLFQNTANINATSRSYVELLNANGGNYTIDCSSRYIVFSSLIAIMISILF